MAVKWKWQYAHREPIDRSRSPKWGPEGAAFWVGKRENGNFWPAYGVRAELKDPKKKRIVLREQEAVQVVCLHLTALMIRSADWPLRSRSPRLLSVINFDN